MGPHFLTTILGILLMQTIHSLYIYIYIGVLGWMTCHPLHYLKKKKKIVHGPFLYGSSAKPGGTWPNSFLFKKIIFLINVLFSMYVFVYLTSFKL